MDGLKTTLLAAGTAVLNLLVAFGLPLTEEQKGTILSVLNTGVIPLALLVVRFYTAAPMKGLEGAQESAGVLK